MILAKILSIFKNLRISEFSLIIESCQLCNWKFMIKTYDDEMGVRCTRCLASPVAQSLGTTFKKYYKPTTKKIYELSSRGAFVRYLTKLNTEITLSEYFDNVESGTIYKGVLCQNVEKLTFLDNSFDICTSLEVFEHVENDIQGFREIYRVLKKTGVFIFTVPIDLNSATIERTKIENGERINILKPEYHSDNIRGVGKIFCYRNYGFDIIDRLLEVGFTNCEIIKPPKSVLFGFGRPVIIASKL